MRPREVLTMKLVEIDRNTNTFKAERSEYSAQLALTTEGPSMDDVREQNPLSNRSARKISQYKAFQKSRKSRSKRV